MAWFRTCLFNLLFWVGSLTYTIVMSPCLISKEATHWGIHIWTRGVLGLMRLVLGLDYQVKLEEKLPQKPAVYACKHQSAWETIACWILVPNALFVMKKEVYYLPGIGLWCWRAGCIAIDRKAGMGAIKKMIREAKERMAEGHNIIIFPEGTRMPVGETRPYLPGVAALYKYLHCPVVPMAVNSGLLWPKNAFVKRRGIINVTMLKAIDPGPPSAEFLPQLQERIEHESKRLLQRPL